MCLGQGEKVNTSTYFQGEYSNFIIMKSKTLKLGGNVSFPGGTLVHQKDPHCRIRPLLCAAFNELTDLLLTCLPYLGAMIHKQVFFFFL